MPFTVDAMPDVDAVHSPKVSPGLSSSSLSTLDISLNFGGSEFDTGTTPLIDNWNFQTMCDRHQDSCPPSMGGPLDSVCEQSLQSFPWADFSMFSENDAQGPDSRNDAKDLKKEKRPRGPKPKYIYSSKEQAAAARKERNRRAALNSYYKRRQRIQDLEKEVDQLSKENSMLQQLFKDLQQGTVDPSDSCSQEKIDRYLREHGL